MLILSRKKNESIVINNDITIIVVEVRDSKVRLGVEAPKEVPVHRKEVYDAILAGDTKENRKELAKRSKLNQPVDQHHIGMVFCPRCQEHSKTERFIEGAALLSCSHAIKENGSLYT